MGKKSPYKEETVEILVRVRINYLDDKGKKEAIKNAISCAKSASIIGNSGCYAKSAKLFDRNSLIVYRNINTSENL